MLADESENWFELELSSHVCFECGPSKLRDFRLDFPVILSTINRPYAWWRFADQFHHHASIPCTICTLLSPSVLVFFSISILWEHICFLNARLGGEIDQQNVIMHKAYSPRKSRENQNQTSALRSYVCQLQPQHRRTVQTFLKKSMKSPAKSKKSLFSTSWNFKSVEAELNRNWTKRRNYRQNWLRMRAVNRLLRFSPPLIWMVLLHLIWMPWDE